MRYNNSEHSYIQITISCFSLLAPSYHDIIAVQMSIIFISTGQSSTPHTMASIQKAMFGLNITCTTGVVLDTPKITTHV